MIVKMDLFEELVLSYPEDESTRELTITVTSDYDGVVIRLNGEILKLKKWKCL
jgi:hypothetical protein